MFESNFARKMKSSVVGFAGVVSVTNPVPMATFVEPIIIEDAGPATPVVSYTESDFRTGVNVPPVAQRTVTSTVMSAYPDGEAGEKRQSPAVPVYEKSCESRPVKSPLNLTSKVNGVVSVLLKVVVEKRFRRVTAT